MRTLSGVARWAGRVLAGLLLLAWGGSFVEHLIAWFLYPGQPSPPLWVWRQQFFHFLMVLGCGLMLRWDRLGTAVLLVASLGFFGLMHWWGFPYIALLNLLPVACFAIFWLLPRRA